MHANIRNNEIIDFNSRYLDEDITRVEATQEMYDLYQQDERAVIYKDGEIVENPEYENLVLEENRLSRIKEIKHQLEQLDLKSIRAIRANDSEYLEMYEGQALGLRTQLAELGYEIVED